MYHVHLLVSYLMVLGYLCTILIYITIISLLDLMVNFESARYIVSEGEEVSLRFVLNSAVDEVLTLNYTTIDYSATGEQLEVYVGVVKYTCVA